MEDSAKRGWFMPIDTVAELVHSGVAVMVETGIIGGNRPKDTHFISVD